MSLFAARGVTRKADPPPLQTDDRFFIGAGTALWAVALLVLLVLRLATDLDVRSWWIQMCAAGIALGLMGLRSVAGRRRRGEGATVENP